MFIEPCCRRASSSVGATWWPGCWPTAADRWHEPFARGDNAPPQGLNGLGEGTSNPGREAAARDGCEMGLSD